LKSLKSLKSLKCFQSLSKAGGFGKVLSSCSISSCFYLFPRVFQHWVTLILGNDLEIKPMPDNNNVVDIYHGPVLSAFQTEKELILKGTRESILGNMRKEKDQYAIELKNNGVGYRLVPFYQISAESYGVYATFETAIS